MTIAEPTYLVGRVMYVGALATLENRGEVVELFCVDFRENKTIAGVRSEEVRPVDQGGS